MRSYSNYKFIISISIFNRMNGFVEDIIFTIQH